MTGRIIICSFASTDIKGRRLRGAARDATYAKLKLDVLAAGRYSVFEATQSQRAADLFMRMHQDPELESFDLGYPWTGIRRRAVAP
jgi:hypothetical protein